MNAIDVRALRVDRGGRTVLHDLSLRIATGAVCGLLGPSGCGKTTLLRALAGVQVIAAGDVVVLGAPAGSAGLRPRVAYVPQGSAVYGDLTVAENLRYFAAIARAGRDAIERALGVVGLEGEHGRLARALSDGQRARVSLACALLGVPDLLILDEPTAGVDPVLRGQLWATFHSLASAGATLLVSSHQMDEAAECDTLVLMRDGAILTHATPAALRARTREHDLGRAFVSLVARGDA